MSETVFGHIKHNLGVRYFLLRGIDGVKAEMNIVSTCFNLTKLMKLLGPKQLNMILST